MCTEAAANGQVRHVGVIDVERGEIKASLTLEKYGGIRLPQSICC